MSSLRSLALFACLLRYSAEALVLQPARVVDLRVGARVGPAVMMAKKAATKKMVTVLLSEDVEGLGAGNTLVQVKPAYAENVLIAKKLGTIASQEVMDQIAKDKAEAEAAGPSVLLTRPRMRHALSRVKLWPQPRL